MYFFVRGCDNPTGQLWVLNFLEPDLKTSVCSILCYPDAETVRRLSTNGNALETEAARYEFESEIKRGRGRVWLQLTEEQYRSLQRR